ncbi:hypothetical protein [Enterobacter sp. 638]|uniref:hypothetical protein n=1 Tax=Enterobacter sp. (strain 638) TaxID=399742 RepID=UPI000A03E2A7|nr:hypothetical protein [Enterobacter sp. 638]
MNARKILHWAATGWTPMLIFIASIVVLYATLHSHFMCVQLTGLLLCGLSGLLLCESMTGGSLWRMLNQQPSDNEGKTSITGHADKDDQG